MKKCLLSSLTCKLNIKKKNKNHHVLRMSMYIAVPYPKTGKKYVSFPGLSENKRDHTIRMVL